jgi:Tfp pilus assembly protein PilN
MQANQLSFSGCPVCRTNRALDKTELAISKAATLTAFDLSAITQLLRFLGAQKYLNKRGKI